MDTYTVDIQNPSKIYSLYTSEFAGLKSDNLKFYFEQARKGVCFFASLLFEDIRRKDLRIGSVCQTRKLAVTRKRWRLAFREESPVSEQMQRELKDFIYNNFEEIDFIEFVANIVEAQIQGISTFETVYAVDGNKLCISNINYIPNHLLTYDDINNTYGTLLPEKVDAMLIKTIGRSTSEDRINLDGLIMPPMDPRKWLEVESLDGNAQNGFLNGCMTSLIWSYFFKSYGLKDWASYVERFATPAVIGTYPPLMSPADRQTLKNAVRDFGHLFRVVIPDGAKIEIAKDNNGSSTNEIFDRYNNYWDKNATIRVLGQSLTTDIGDVGSQAAAQTHNTVREDLVVSDMMLVESAVNKVIRNLLNLNYASLPEYPKFEFEEAEDIMHKLTRSQILTNLKTAGYKARKEDLEKEFGWELEEISTDQGTYNEENPETGTNKYIKKFIQEFYDGIQR
jgi:phage gp29-like protein